jgi:3',5'-cyclic AMP phosphodiesterase CpdA
MLLAQISDPHIGADPAFIPHGLSPARTLERAIAQLLASTTPPDAVLVSGDLVERGGPVEYAELRALLAPLCMPVYLMVGNHDTREALRDAFPDHAFLHTGDDFVQYAFDADTWRIVVLDSLDPGVSSGRVCERRLQWLDRELSASRGRDVALFVHHQPFATGIAHVDSSRLLDAGPFEQIVRRHGNVRRVSCGHVHRAMQSTWAGAAATTCPSVYFEFAPDFRADGRYVPAPEMPGYQLHRFSRGELLTYTVAVH